MSRASGKRTPRGTFKARRELGTVKFTRLGCIAMALDGPTPAARSMLKGTNKINKNFRDPAKPDAVTAARNSEDHK